MFGGFDLSSIVEAGNKLTKGVGSNIGNWDNGAEEADPAGDVASVEGDDATLETHAESSTWNALGFGNALQKVQDTNSSLEQLWGSQVSQLPDFSSYLAGDQQDEASVGSASDNELQGNPHVSADPAAEGVSLSSAPVAKQTPRNGVIDALRAGHRTRKPRLPRHPSGPFPGVSERSPGEADVRNTNKTGNSEAVLASAGNVAVSQTPAAEDGRLPGAIAGWDRGQTTRRELAGAEASGGAESAARQQQSDLLSWRALPEVDSKEPLDTGSCSSDIHGSPKETAVADGVAKQASTSDAIATNSGNAISDTAEAEVPLAALPQRGVVQSMSLAAGEGPHPSAQPSFPAVAPTGPAADHTAADPTANGTTSDDSATHSAAAVPMPATHEAACEALKDAMEALAVREMQLERKSREITDTEALCRHLQEQNEAQELRDSPGGGQDLDSVRAEAAQRVAAAERKVYALSKERDALKRGSEKLTSATDLLKEKDDIIRQVMEEGEVLSKKQLAQESTIRKLRTAAKEAAEKYTSLQAELASQNSRLRNTIASATASDQAKQESEEQHLSERQQERQHYEGLLTKARSAQAAAEQSAAAGQRDASTRLLKEAEARREAAEEVAAELRATLEQQQATFSHREDRAAREAAELQRRVAEADARHEELAARLPEATQPLVRQLESVHAAAEAQAASWAATERSLSRRRADAEARATVASESARAATERLQATQGRIAALAGSLEAAKAEAAECQTITDEQRQVAAEAESRAARLQERLTAATASAATERTQKTELQQRIQDLSDAREELTAQVERLADSLAAADNATQRHEQQLHARQQGQQGQQQQVGGAGPPPAMPGMGYKWVLVKGGNEGAALQQLPTQQQQHVASAPKADQWSSASSAADDYGSTDSAKVSALREGMRHREDQLTSLRSEIGRLEDTRDSLAEELVAAAQAQEAAAVAKDSAEMAQRHTHLMAARLAAAEELLGEREESLSELRADLADVKQVYREQIEFCVAAVAAAQQNGDAILSLPEAAVLRTARGMPAKSQDPAAEEQIGHQ